MDAVANAPAPLKAALCGKQIHKQEVMIAMRKLILFLMIFVFVSGVSAEEERTKTKKRIISVNLLEDAVYRGAFIDSDANVFLYDTGHMKNARLKEDHAVNGVVFERGKDIAFYQNGSVWRGALRDEATIHDINFVKGSIIEFYPSGIVKKGTAKAGGNPGGLNLVLPIDMVLSFDRNGHVNSVSTDTVSSFNILGMPCTRKVRVIYDESTKKYKLFSGIVSKPIVIAALPTSMDNMGSPTSAEPIVAPTSSSFQLYLDNPVYASGQQSYDSWKTNKRIVINNYSFDGPKLFVRDMRLVGVQVYKKTVLDGYEFKPLDVVTFNNIGKVNPPK